jgi:hypothetical protein
LVSSAVGVDQRAERGIAAQRHFGVGQLRLVALRALVVGAHRLAREPLGQHDLAGAGRAVHFASLHQQPVQRRGEARRQLLLAPARHIGLARDVFDARDLLGVGGLPRIVALGHGRQEAGSVRAQAINGAASACGAPAGWKIDSTVSGAGLHTSGWSRCAAARQWPLTSPSAMSLPSASISIAARFSPWSPPLTDAITLRPSGHTVRVMSCLRAHALQHLLRDQRVGVGEAAARVADHRDHRGANGAAARSTAAPVRATWW